MRRSSAASIAVVFIAVCSPAVNAESATGAAGDAVVACLEIVDPAQRLSCFETAARALQSQRAEKVVEAKQAQEDAFGASGLESAKRAERDPARITRLDAGVTKVTVGPLKNVTVVLDNGQIWRQREGDRFVVRPPRDGRSLTASVRKGALSSFWMRINELDREFRVERIK